MSASAQAKAKDDFTLVITREFDAPRSLVYEAWTNKAHALKWSGPRDFPVVETDHDVRPGGKWRGCLKGPEGQKLWQGGEYREVVPNERLVFTFGWDEDKGKPGAETLITIVFTDKGEKTEMVFTQEGLATASSRDGHRGGWNSSFDRLEEFLAGA